MTTPDIDPIHPGEVLADDFLAPHNLSVGALPTALRVPAGRMNEIVRARRAITAETALRLARYFETTPELWMNLQADYDLRAAAAEDNSNRAGGRRRS